jgi:acyl-coenzyme A synthetase/AMP-(fatty) acid ligase
MTSIRNRLANTPGLSARFFRGASAAVCLGDLQCGTALGGSLGALAGRAVLLSTRDPLAAALALIELDGIARRIVVCTPDLAASYLPLVIRNADIDALVSDHQPGGAADVSMRVSCGVIVRPKQEAPPSGRSATEWVLLTSGTTGEPKMLVHSLDGLTAAIDTTRPADPGVVWGTFYDIRRYGGLQIFLRAVLGRGSFVLTDTAESTGDYLTRLAEHGVTHLSGTPSHWRRALMTPQARLIAPRYVRLSGEIADQGILNALKAFYPDASVGHAFASTEAGVGFEVNDGLEGFPASTLSASDAVAMKIEDGSLRIRSNRNAVRHLGGDGLALADEDGFVDTGDMVELRSGRYYFLGRKSGVINIGGLKVYPEEVETVINRHPSVRMSVVRARRSPITGSLVAADVVLTDGSAAADEVRSQIIAICHQTLPAHKIPATIRFVPSLEVAAAGKLARSHA